MRTIVWFDDTVRGRNGNIFPFWSFVTLESEIKDQELTWFHERYGWMQLYRLWKVDAENFVAEKIGRKIRKDSDEYKEWRSKPELALAYFQ